LAIKQDLLAGRQTQLEASHKELRHQILDALDGIASRFDVDATDRVALSAQVTRHEDWIVEAAPKVGVDYVPGS